MPNQLECVIESVAREEGIFYYLKKSPKIGITERGGILLCNEPTDPLYSTIQRYASDYTVEAKYRLLVTLEKPYAHLEPNKAISIEVLESR